MSTFVTVQFKKTFEIDIIKPLKNLIAANYSTADNPVDCSDALNELDKLRNNAVCRPLDRHVTSLEVLYRYYDQLNAVEKKIAVSDLQIPFKWRDAFDKGGLFTGKMSLTIPSLAYERVCVMFNMAVLHSQIAAVEDLNSDEGLKNAAKYFQMSSGIFHHLKNTVISSIQREPTPDLHPDTLSALQALMLAHAQEVFYHKVVNDRMKDAVIAKIAMQCQDLYADALKQMQRESLKSMWEKEWIPMVACKQYHFHSKAQYHQSLVAKENKSVGEEVARLEYAVELIKTASSKSLGLCEFSVDADRLSKAHAQAKKDNDFIYHERVPDIRSLPAISKAALAKAIPPPDVFSANFTDLFGNLTPVQVHQSLGRYDVRRDELVNAEVGKLREETNLMNGVLSSMNLPAALEDSSGNEVPRSIFEKAQVIKDKGGAAVIEQMMNELPDLLQRNTEVLDVIDRMLKEEEESDAQLKSQFKERWNRTPSDKLTEPMKQDSAKYRQIISNAVDADKIIRDKYGKNKKWIHALSGADENLKSLIPSTNPTSGLHNNPAVQNLKRLMEGVESIKAERDVIESELKSTSTDMKDRFLTALKEDGGINEELLSTEVLGQVYGPLQKQVRENTERQKTLMDEIQAANAEFCKLKGQNKSAVQRETALTEIAAAHDAFIELLEHLQEGAKFYNDLTRLLVNFQNKVSDFCFARKTEKEELCKDLQQSIVNQPNQATPALPSHHGGTNRTVPPSRPPPPTDSRPVPAPRTNIPTSAPVGVTAAANAPMAQPLPYPTANQQQSIPPYPYVPYPNYPQPPMPSAYNPYAQPNTQYGQYPPAPAYQPYGGQQSRYPPPPPTYPPQYPGQWR